MAHLPAWDRQLAAWTRAAQSGPSQLREAMAGLATLGETTTRELRERAAARAERTRNRCEEIPRAMAAELRRRINVLDLATRTDVEQQLKIDEGLLESFRAELRETLESFATAIADDLFGIDQLPASSGPAFVDDYDIDLAAYDEAPDANRREQTAQ